MGIAIAFVRLALSGLQPLSMLIVCAAVFGVIFLAAILLLNIPTIEERLFVRKQLSRFSRPTPEPVGHPVTRS